MPGLHTNSVDVDDRFGDERPVEDPEAAVVD